MHLAVFGGESTLRTYYRVWGSECEHSAIVESMMHVLSSYHVLLIHDDCCVYLLRPHCGAVHYRRYGSVFEGAIDHMFRNSGLKATDKFLDIGCGIGSIVLQAAAWAGCQAAVSNRASWRTAVNTSC